MKHSGYSISHVILIAMMSLLTSCIEPLCYDHYPTADVNFVWEAEWERDYGMDLATLWDEEGYGFGYDELRPGTPEWVHVLHYNKEGNLDQDFLGPEGGKLIVDTQKENSMLFYNGDTEYIILSDMASLPEARASASSRSRSRSSISYVLERHPDSRSTNPPDILYVAYLDKLPDIAMHEVKKLPVKMQPLVYTYVIRYEFEKGLKYVSLARGALGGMAESVYLRDGVTSDETSIILYDCDMKPFGFEAHVRSFGVPGFPDEYYGRGVRDKAERPYSLNLEVMLKNGRFHVFDFDISDQIKNQPRGGVITVSGIRIEDDEGDAPIGSGFDVDVEGWGKHEDIKLEF